MPSPTPTATAQPISISVARTAGPGARINVEGVVTAEAGTIGVPALVAIQDTTGGLVVRLPDGAARPARGAVVTVSGKLADPYGQLEVRPTADGLAVNGSRPLPDPLPVAGASLGEATEGRLVVIEGTLDATISREANGDVVLRLVDAAGVPFRARAGRTSGVETTVARAGARLRLTGVVGQRASSKGALDGYRVWLRRGADLVVVAPAPTASAKPSASPGAGSGATDPKATTAPIEPIRSVLRRARGGVRVEGVVTTPATLLDATGRRIIVQDRSAAVEVLLPAGTAAPREGLRVRVAGLLGTAYGAPRIRASTIVSLGSGTVPTPRRIAGEPGVNDEAELVRLEGDVVDVQRLGDRWRAEVRTSRAVVVVAGLAGAGIPAATLIEGGRATVTGVVRRPHPAASDRRFAVAPRAPADVRATGAPEGATASTRAATAGAPGAPGATGRPPWVAAPATTPEVPDADIATLADRLGRTVRVGGLVVAATEAGVVIDDGTATGELRLVGEAASLRPLLEPGDAVSAAGRVVAGTVGPAVEVDDPAGLVRLGDLGEALPIAPAPGAGPATDPGDVEPAGAVGGSTAASLVSGAAISVEAGSPPIAKPTDGPPSGVAAALGALLAIAAAAALAGRRLRDRRRLAGRISTRLEALAAPAPAAAVTALPGRPVGERGPSVRGPA